MPPMRGLALLTANEVAATLRVQPSTVYRWINAGALPSLRFEGTVRVPVAELRRFAGIDQSETEET